jgi:hypothetical protein
MGMGASAIARSMTEDQKSTVRVGRELLVELRSGWKTASDKEISRDIDKLANTLDLGSEPLRRRERIVGYGKTHNHWMSFCVDVPSATIYLYDTLNVPKQDDKLLTIGNVSDDNPFQC